ncbi:uncharacterized protein LOC131882406 isoform X2 [Tigriopus californicus]|uniref:uncharacterized protein LOC131882406 isoform X2 n=1 Tax=Tigriopus californicus TaxID=6832 RepID=UPI0027DA7A80|nr:uncharacterized protein LOC131882406 isoform X2 [Tigriopus californicus]
MGLLRLFRRKQKWVLGIILIIFVVYRFTYHESESEPSGRKLKNTGGVSVFDYDRYLFAKSLNPIPEDSCLLINPNGVPYHVCIHKIEEDIYISDSIRNGWSWEPILSRHIGSFLDQGGWNSILVDIGANIGIHSLFAAKLGHRVFAVEPLDVNLVKMFHASLLDGTSNSMTILENAIDMYEHEAIIQKNVENLGGSYLTPQIHGLDQLNPNTVHIPAVRLVQILHLISNHTTQTERQTVVMKMDIEKQEGPQWELAWRKKGEETPCIFERPAQLASLDSARHFL